MDGVSATAGVLGIVSSVHLLLRTVSEIYGFWKTIEDAPQDISIILLQLEFLQEFLKFAQDVSVTGVMEKVTMLLSVQVGQLNAITQNLERGFGSGGQVRRVWARCKAAKKMERLREFRNSLEETKSSLILFVVFATSFLDNQSLSSRPLFSDRSTYTTAEEATTISPGLCEQVVSMQIGLEHINLNSGHQSGPIEAPPSKSLREGSDLALSEVSQNSQVTSTYNHPQLRLRRRGGWRQQKSQQVNTIIGTFYWESGYRRNVVTVGGQSKDLVQQESGGALFDDYIEFGYDGWELALMLGLSAIEDLGKKDSMMAWALERHIQSIRESEDRSVLACLASFSLHCSSLKTLELCLKILPEGSTIGYVFPQTLLHQLLSEHRFNSVWGHKTTKTTREVLRLLRKYKQGCHVICGKETPLSQGLWFSYCFQEWRSSFDDQLNNFLEAEIQNRESPLTRRAWDAQSLSLLFKVPSLKTEQRAKCRHVGFVDSIERDIYREANLVLESRLVEPWWEQVKEEIRTSKCLSYVENYLAELDTQQQTGSSESQAMYQASRSSSTDGIDCTWNEHYFRYDFDRDISRVRKKRMRKLLEKDSLAREQILDRFSAQERSWQDTYQPGDTICFKCLAQREGWIPDQPMPGDFPVD
ncbi:MAG: hypothetical protein Q9162_002082 [Coniocarpon cinnabarinum]